MKTEKKNKSKKAKTLNDSSPIGIQKRSKKAERVNEKSKIDVGFPIVGIGASAGGLQAFEEFFSGWPTATATEPGMAFVLVQHLSPDHKSILADLIRRCTSMPVFEIENGMQVLINCIYIIPPNRNLELVEGRLRLFAYTEPRGIRLPIDFFFRSLAKDQHERAIGIVLSGTGSDGSLGVRAIKGEGGMIMAQTPESTTFDGMPQSAIATGQVDYTLLPTKMPAQLLAYVAHAFGTLPHLAPETEQPNENALKKIFSVLRAQNGHDFSQYKPSTLYRRIDRRMAVHQINTIDQYVKYLQQRPLEGEALFRDLLIGVTSFFRDPEFFQALENQVIPRLLADKPAGSLVRVWSAGCSTGEEAYSIAILLQEQLEKLKQNYTVQVFATDIDNQAITKARTGVYPTSIVADITPTRLARFFTAMPDQSAYRIHKGIRDMMIFSEQNLIKDPPFSKLDLISCRNLLIYLSAELQSKVIPMFHYALKPGGILFLGASEGVGDFGDLFSVLDRKAKLFQRKEDIHGMQRRAHGPFLAPTMDIDSPRERGRIAFPAKLPLREIAEQALLQQIAPAAALVNAQGNILYLHGRTGMYLEPSPGETSTSNILKMAREGLRPALFTALRKAVATKENVLIKGLSVKTNGHFAPSKLSVHPVATGSTAMLDSPLYLILLQEDAAPPKDIALKPHAIYADGDGSDLSTDARIEALEQELRAKDEYLDSANEELQTSYEELKSSNEEMQSVNEELQSTNEELETSKEELQSVNEELATVNNELHTMVVDLTRTNNDMNNLLAGTCIATVFVDQQLNILRFTPPTAEIINLIPSDVGRSVGHIVLNLVGYNQLMKDAQAVLNTLIPIETQVQTTKGTWFTMRIQPYRTLDNMIDGVVITFMDITAIKLMEEALEKANRLSRLAVVVRDAQDAITVQDLKGQTLAWNPSAERMYGYSEAEALTLNVQARIPKSLHKSELSKLQDLCLDKIMKPYRTQRLAKDGAVLDVWIIVSPLIDETGKIYAIATTERSGELTKAVVEEDTDDH